MTMHFIRQGGIWLLDNTVFFNQNPFQNQEHETGAGDGQRGSRRLHVAGHGTKTSRVVLCA
jgi:hypothetical protein